MFFRIIPEISLSQNRLRLETAKFIRFISLGCYCRTVEIDRSAGKVIIETVWMKGCFRNSREIPFSEIIDVETGYDSVKDKYGRDYYETFTIFLKIKKDYISKPVLAVFRGPAGRSFFSSGKTCKEEFHEYFDKMLIYLGRKKPDSKRPFIFPSIIHEKK